MSKGSFSHIMGIAHVNEIPNVKISDVRLLDICLVYVCMCTCSLCMLAIPFIFSVSSRTLLCKELCIERLMKRNKVCSIFV